MFRSGEKNNAAKFYQLVKKDLHTLMVKGSDSPLDYDGMVSIYPKTTTISYSITDECSYQLLADLCSCIEDMLKFDLRLWGKTQGVERIEVAPSLSCDVVVLELFFQN